MYIKIEVITEAKEEWVRQIKPDSFVCSVRETATRNQANRRVLEIIRQALGGKNTNIRIISGHHSPRKIISVETGTSGIKMKNRL